MNVRTTYALKKVAADWSDVDWTSIGAGLTAGGLTTALAKALGMGWGGSLALGGAVGGTTGLGTHLYRNSRKSKAEQLVDALKEPYEKIIAASKDPNKTTYENVKAGASGLRTQAEKDARTGLGAAQSLSDTGKAYAEAVKTWADVISGAGKEIADATGNEKAMRGADSVVSAVGRGSADIDKAFELIDAKIKQGDNLITSGGKEYDALVDWLREFIQANPKSKKLVTMSLTAGHTRNPSLGLDKMLVDILKPVKR